MNNIREPLLINNMQLRNRLALPAITTNSSTAEGEITEEVFDFYRARAGAVGLVIVEATAIRPDGRLVPNSPGLWEDRQVAGMSRLAETIKGQGACAVVQLNHAGARCVPAKGSLIGASPSGFQFRSDIEPLILSEAQVEQLTNDFAGAAARAISAGFDGVEIHGAHFYLLSQFISPYTNQRTDRFGGDLKGRARFALTVIQAVREKIGADHSILFRLNAVEGVPGGQTIEDAAELGRLLADAGVDLLDVSFAGNSSWQELGGTRHVVIASALARGELNGKNTGHAAYLKKETGLPVIAVGKLWDKPSIVAALENNQVDIIAIGRQMIADPLTAEKILLNRFEEITNCKECATCYATIRRGVPMQCAVFHKQS
jgi:2,4-dienoyl-CoA reductase-like NADH-dependent reductase (Old Yellow Enzyme family)